MNPLELFDEVKTEDMGALDEWFDEEFKPILDYLKQQRKKELEKEYEEVKRLEMEAR